MAYEKISLKDQRDRFELKYETLFGPWPGAKSEEHAREWYRLIDALSFEHVDDLFRFVAEGHTGKYAPRLAAFWKVWKQIRPKRRKDADKAPESECALCNNTGRMWTVCRRVETDHGTFFYEISLSPETPLYWFNAPCYCSKGESLITSSTNLKFREEIYRWRKDMLPGIVADCGKAYSLGTGEYWYCADIVRQSWQGPARTPERPSKAMEAESVVCVAPEAEARQIAGGSPETPAATNTTEDYGYETEEVPF